MPEAPLVRPELPPVAPETPGTERFDQATIPTAEQPPDAGRGESAPVQPIPVPSNAPVPLTPVAAPLQQHVEEVMSAGLADTYAQMDPATQQRFRTVGEQTASKISVLLQASKVQVKKIVDLLVAWLRIIPGVNTFFLEQEAKIKADKILSLTAKK